MQARQSSLHDARTVNPALVQSVILANETVIARIKSIKLLTLGVLEIFGY